MKLGTKSVLYGYHCVAIHWIFVAFGWWRLYGFRAVLVGHKPPSGAVASYRAAVWTMMLDPRLWLAFVIHDLGYWGKPNMDGPEGETHPYWAAKVMERLFGAPWGEFTKYHSRFLAKKEHARPSPLCFADKLAIVYMPSWLYLIMIHATGEVKEYMQNATVMIERGGHPDARAWLRDVKAYARAWVNQYKDGRTDTTTPLKSERATVSDTGVWK